MPEAPLMLALGLASAPVVVVAPRLSAATGTPFFGREFFFFASPGAGTHPAAAAAVGDFFTTPTSPAVGGFSLEAAARAVAGDDGVDEAADDSETELTVEALESPLPPTLLRLAMAAAAASAFPRSEPDELELLLVALLLPPLFR